MKVVIKPERGIRKISVNIRDDLWRRIEDMSRKYGVEPEYILKLALIGDFRETSKDIEELEKKVRELEKQVWKLETEYSPLRFKAYGVSEDNKLLAIRLLGAISENNQLRRFLGMKPEARKELRKLISYYLQG